MSKTPALPAMLGTWHIVATTLPFWKGKRGARVEYVDLGEQTWRDIVRYEDARGRTKEIAGRDRLEGGPVATDARVRWRGEGWLAWISSDWRFVEVDPEGQWAITWFSRASFRVTPEGMDVYTRSRDHAGIDALVQRAASRSESSRCGPWFRTE